MAVYVDRAANPFGRMIMCHMIADSVAELHAFARCIGLQEDWFQPFSRPHYDLSKDHRSVAIKAGAIDCDRAAFVAAMKAAHPTWLAEYAAARAAGKPWP